MPQIRTRPYIISAFGSFCYSACLAGPTAGVPGPVLTGSRRPFRCGAAPGFPALRLASIPPREQFTTWEVLGGGTIMH
jgi:hypothetical protein